MARYILNSAVITKPGRYYYRLISDDDAKRWLNEGPYESTIGYEETAMALSIITGRPIACNRKNIQMNEGDEALIFRLTCRMNDPDLKGKLTPEFVLKNCEIGILRREK
jgi:hypothetical protein